MSGSSNDRAWERHGHSHLPSGAHEETTSSRRAALAAPSESHEPPRSRPAFTAAVPHAPESHELRIVDSSRSKPTSQGYAIRSAARRVELAGMDRAGVFQAAYEFLSSGSGTGSAPGEDIVPRRGPTTRVPTARRTCGGESAGLRLSRPHAAEWSEFSGRRHIQRRPHLSYVDWMAKNKMNVGTFFRDYRRPYWKKLRSHFRSMKARGLQIAVGDHLYRFFVPGARLARTRPEWFRGVADKPGEDYINAELSQAHFCGSNPRAVRYFIRGVQAFLDEARTSTFSACTPTTAQLVRMRAVSAAEHLGSVPEDPSPSPTPSPHPTRTSGSCMPRTVPTRPRRAISGRRRTWSFSFSRGDATTVSRSTIRRAPCTKAAPT